MAVNKRLSPVTVGFFLSSLLFTETALTWAINFSEVDRLCTMIGV